MLNLEEVVKGKVFYLKIWKIGCRVESRREGSVGKGDVGEVVFLEVTLTGWVFIRREVEVIEEF